MIRRIRQRSTFYALRRHGRRSRSGPITLTHLPADLHPPRVGFAINRAVGSAVTRNRLRRRVRAIMDEACRAGRLPDGTYLISAAPKAALLDYSQLGQVLDGAIVQVDR